MTYFIISIFLPQMKHKNVYNVAVSYEAYCQQKSDPFKQLKANIQLLNIFKGQPAQKKNEKELEKSKTYDVVGYKELISYRQKMKLLKRNTSKRMTFDRTDRTSTNTKNSKSDAFSKEELIQNLPCINKDKSIEYVSKLKNKWALTEPDSGEQFKNNKKCQYSSFFSLTRLKKHLKKQQIQWKKIFPKEGQDQKFPSIYKSIELFRSKIEKRQQTINIQDLVNLQSSHWKDMLRQDSIKDLSLKQQVVRSINNENLTTRGVSKLNLEKEWLEVKEQQGYQFKQLKDLKDTLKIR